MNARWKFTGYDSLETFFEQTAVMSESCARETLRLLASRALSEREIIDTHTKGSKSTLLDVRPIRDGLVFGFTCGENPWFTAIVDKRR